MQREQTAELSRNVVWHGRTEDAARLIRSVGDHCTCGPGAPLRGAGAVCTAHQILTDQHTLDHLAFARSVLNRILDEEWQGSAMPTSWPNTPDWSALMAERIPEHHPAPAFTPGSAPHAASGRSAFAASLLALLLVFSLGAQAFPFDAPIGRPIASWLGR